MLKISNTYIPCDNVANPSAGLGSGLRCGRWFTKEEFLPEVQMGLWALGTVAILPRENREQGLLGSVPHSRANGLRAVPQTALKPTHDTSPLVVRRPRPLPARAPPTEDLLPPRPLRCTCGSCGGGGGGGKESRG